MKREFLENLEVGGVKLPKEVIDQIMAENGKDITAEQTKVTAKDGELSTANKTIKDLQDAVKKFDGVDVTALNKQITDLQGKYDKDITETKLNSALEVALMQNKAKNNKAVKALLDQSLIKLDGDKILGLEEQLTKLKTEADYLFEMEATPADPSPSGVTINSGGGHGRPIGTDLDSFVASARKAAGLSQATT